MSEHNENGLVVRVTGSDVWVQQGASLVSCQLRGRLRQEKGLQVVAGDRVVVTPPPTASDTGAIESIAPRVSFLSRFVERTSRERGIVANVDMLFVVTTLISPPLHYAFVDRVLVSAERGQVAATVVLNKMDLIETEQGDEVTSIYTRCGYEVLRTSASTSEGVDAVAERIGSGIYAFVGASGVGKSSLLNRLDPDLDIKTREIGEKTGRGRHTTTQSQLYPFRGGYLADTPGVQTFGFAGDDRAELADGFPEMRPLEGGCRFSPCTHSHEPGCAVKDALEAGDIAQSRYDSYLHILAEIDAREKKRGW